MNSSEPRRANVLVFMTLHGRTTHNAGSEHGDGSSGTMLLSMHGVNAFTALAYMALLGEHRPNLN